jgi:hypothetical protein
MTPLVALRKERRGSRRRINKRGRPPPQTPAGLPDPELSLLLTLLSRFDFETKPQHPHNLKNLND